MSSNKKETEIALPMADRAPVGRSLLWMVWSGMISIANSILIWVLFARLRDVDELGRFTIVMGLYALFYSVCTLGLFPFLVSEMTKRRAQSDQAGVASMVSTSAVFLSIAGAACAVAMGLFGLWASPSESAHISVAILATALIPTALIGICEATAVSAGKTKLIAVVSTLENIIRTIVPAFLIWEGFGIPAICFSFVVVRFVALSLYLVAARAGFSAWKFSRLDFKLLLNVTPTFAGTIILASINWQAAIILLGHFSTEAESAKFGVASRFLIPVTILMASYANVIQPLIVKAGLTGPENIGAELTRRVRGPATLFTAAAIFSPFLSGRVLGILFGETYTDAALTLDVLAVSAVPFCLVMVAARALVAMDAQKIDLLANGVGVVVFFATALSLIPTYGAAGAAVGQLLSFTVMTLIELLYISRKTKRLNLWRTASLSGATVTGIHLLVWNF